MLKGRRAAYGDIGNLGSEAKEAIENLAVAGVFENLAGNSFEPQKEMTSKEFAAYFIRSVGYWANTDEIFASRYDEAVAIAEKLGAKIGDEPITGASAAEIAAGMIKAADVSKRGDTGQILESLGVGTKTGDAKLTRASGALLIYRLTAGIFALPTSVAN